MSSSEMNGTTKQKDSPPEKKGPQQNPLLPLCTRIYSWRWATVVVTFFGYINLTIMGNSFNMALVCMTGSAPKPRVDDNSSLAANFTQQNLTVYELGEFDWDEASQGILLSASMYVSFITPAISGFLARRYGPRRVVGYSVSCRAILHLLTPLLARAHLYVLVAARVIQGGITNTMIPSTQGLWAHWAPDQEKVQITAWTQSGVNIGTLMASLVSGFLCLIPIDNGWPFVFYVFGTVSVAWCVVWWVMVYDTPEDHRWIKQSEVKYIRDNIRARPDKTTAIPYKAFLTSKPLYAYFVIQTTHKWCATIYFAYIPKYMRDVLRFPIDQNAIVSSVPFASRFLGVIFWGALSDYMAKKHFSTTTNRKVVQGTGFLVCAALTVGLGFISEEYRFVAVAVFVISTFFQSCTFASAAVIPLDLAPKLSAVIVGVYQSIGNALIIFAPLSVAYMTPDGTLEQWRNVFYTMTAVYIFGITFFLLFGSGELQPWSGSAVTHNLEPPKQSEHTNGVVTRDKEEIFTVEPKVVMENKGSGQEETSGKILTSVHIIGSAVEGGIINKAFLADEEGNTGDNIQRECTGCDDVVNNRGEGYPKTEYTCSDDVTNSESQVTKL